MLQGIWSIDSICCMDGWTATSEIKLIDRTDFHCMDRLEKKSTTKSCNGPLTRRKVPNVRLYSIHPVVESFHSRPTVSDQITPVVIRIVRYIPSMVYRWGPGTIPVIEDKSALAIHALCLRMLCLHTVKDHVIYFTFAGAPRQKRCSIFISIFIKHEYWADPWW